MWFVQTISCRWIKSTLKRNIQFYMLRFGLFQSIIAQVIILVMYVYQVALGIRTLMTLKASLCDQMLLCLSKDQWGSNHPPSAEQNEGGLTYNGSSILWWAPQLCYYVIREEGMNKWVHVCRRGHKRRHEFGKLWQYPSREFVRWVYQIPWKLWNSEIIHWVESTLWKHILAWCH